MSDQRTQPNPMVYYCDCVPLWHPAQEGEGQGDWRLAVVGLALGLGLVLIGLWG